MGSIKKGRLQSIGKLTGELILLESLKNIKSLLSEFTSDEEIELRDGAIEFFEWLLILSAFGVFIAEHYSRNYLEDDDRIKTFVPAMLKKLLIQLPASHKSLGGSPNFESLKHHLQHFYDIHQFYENCLVVHRGGSESRDWNDVALGRCAMLSMSLLIRDESVPEHQVENWEEIDKGVGKIYDICREKVWEYHNTIKVSVENALLEQGYQQVRDLGADLHP